VLLAAKQGKCIRFPVGDVRVFRGRDSVGVRGISLGPDDQVISMSILRHAEFETEERDAYLRLAALRRRDEKLGEEGAEDTGEESQGAAREAEESASAAPAIALSEERFAGLAASEEFILTVSSAGFGKRTSAYEYRVTGRGGKGIEAIDLGRDAATTLVAAFPVVERDQIMLVTDGGQLIRCPVHDVRIAGRTTRGVTLFRVSEEERVVSVIRLGDVAGDEGSGGDEGAVVGEEAGEGPNG
jgi:DNA gyrase subunit A